MDERKIRKEVAMNNDVQGSKRRKLAEAMEESYENLLTSVRVLIWKMGMAGSREEADDLSHEILNETVLTAIEIEERYDPTKSIHAWLMSIAANKIRGLRTKESRRSKYMGGVTESYKHTRERSTSDRNKALEHITEDEMIDYLVTYSTSNNPLNNKIHISFDELVSLVGLDDRHVLKLAFVYNLKGKDLAATLKISEGAANVRLSRAIKRLQQAYLASEVSERSEK